MDLEFGQWVKRRRRALDLTQDDLAKRAFCSVNSIRKIEAGDLTPSKALASELARALAVLPEQEEAFVRFARTREAHAPENAFLATRETAADAAPVSTTAAPGHRDAPPPTTRVHFYPPASVVAAIGREQDVNVVIHTLRLPATRLATLTGPPGTGKTRLSIEVANALEPEMEHGAAFVELAPLAHAALVEGAVAQALGVRESAGLTPGAALRAFLRDKQLLLVLDNFEHLPDAAPRATEWLSAAPRLKILATSREPLRVYGERELPVAPLALPPLAPLPSPELLLRYAAVQLFVERSQQARHDFELNAANAEAVARICVTLDGLPLAIEMAAARVKWETPQELLTQLARRLETLKTRIREREPRQQTLRGAIDWSYERLDAAEQHTLRHLGVFRGGLTREAADSVCGAVTGERLENLVDKSLVKFESEARFTLLEMIREYALDKLDAAGETDAAHRRHAEFYTALAEWHEPAIRSAGGFDLAHALDPDQDNLRAALEWCITHREGALALRMAAALAAYWDRKSAAGEGTQWLDRVLAMDIEPDEELLFARAKARDGYAEFIRLNGDYTRAREMLNAALDDWRNAGPRGKPFLAGALIPSSRVALDQGDDALAYALGMEALQVNTELHDAAGLCQAYRRLADWALTQQKLDDTAEWLVLALRYADEADSDHERCTTLRLRGDLYRMRGEWDKAAADYARGLELNEWIKDDYAEIRGKRSLGVVALRQGDLARGKQLLREAAQLSDRVGNLAALALAFCNMALAAGIQGDAARTMQLLGAMDTLMDKVEMRLIAPDLFEYQNTLARVAALAEETALQDWRAEGQQLPYEQARVLLHTA